MSVDAGAKAAQMNKVAVLLPFRLFRALHNYQTAGSVCKPVLQESIFVYKTATGEKLESQWNGHPLVFISDK